MNRWTLPVLICVVVCLASTQLACVRYERAALPDSRRFELLHQRKLSAFEQRLAAEVQTGRDDDWTVVGQAWLQLINCQPISTSMLRKDAKPLPRFVFETLRLEDIRRSRLLYHKGTAFRDTSITGTVFSKLDDEGFFTRKPDKIKPDVVKWPAAEEAWADELPAQRAIKSTCQKFYQAVFKRAATARAAWDKAQAKAAEDGDVVEPRTRMNLRPDDDPKKLVKDSLAWWQHQELVQTQRVATLAGALAPTQRRAYSIDAAAWRIQYHRASLFGELGFQLTSLNKMSFKEAEYAKAWSEKNRAALMPLAEREMNNNPAPVKAGLRAFVVLIHSEDLRQKKQYSKALRGFKLAESIGVDGQNRYLGRYLHVRTLFDMRQWKDVMAYANKLPPSSSRYYPPMIYRVAYAMRRTGDVDRFMATTMKAFRDKPYRADPFMRALYINMLRVLTEYPFEARIIELLEDMGHRSLIYERMEEYATIALDRGKAENARAAANWLLAKHLNAQYRPRYHALLALAAFLQDNNKLFTKHLADVTYRAPQLLQAIPTYRQATFFAAADAQMARVFRQMLPVMAEWGESKKAKALRQKWLLMIVDRAQAFVRTTPGSLARPSLVELYRIASAMLTEQQPRSYPETVGKDEPTPLVLGTVKVESRDLSPYEPGGTFRGETMRTLTVLPRDAKPLSDWSPSWSEPSWPDHLKALKDARRARERKKAKSTTSSNAVSPNAASPRTKEAK